MQVTFDDLRISSAATGLRLRFTAGSAPPGGPFAPFPGTSPVTSDPFEVRVGDVHTLAVRVTPDGCVLGRACVQPAVIELVDAGGNGVAAAASPVTLLAQDLSNTAQLYFNRYPPPQDPAAVPVTHVDGAAVLPVDGVAQVPGPRNPLSTPHPRSPRSIPSPLPPRPPRPAPGLPCPRVPACLPACLSRSLLGLRAFSRKCAALPEWLGQCGRGGSRRRRGFVHRQPASTSVGPRAARAGAARGEARRPAAAGRQGARRRRRSPPADASPCGCKSGRRQ